MRPFGTHSVLILFFVVGMFSKLGEAQIDKDVMQFIGDVIVRTEFGPRNIDFVKRWTKSPTLSTFGPGDQHPKKVKNAVDQINALLPKDLQVIVLEPGDDSADIKVYFDTRENFPDIAKEHDFTVPKGCVAYFQHWWNGRRELNRAVVLIPTDDEFSRRRQHIVLEEITQSLGAGGDSDRFKNSVFYEKLEKKEYGHAAKFHQLDKQLIRFLYQHVPPGASGLEVGYLLAKHWEIK